jgi:hypothetical protein
MAQRGHKGIYQYSGDEGGNLALGQMGFKEVAGSGSSGDGNWVAFKVVGGAATATAVVSATCHQGDAFPSTTMVTGEMVWGAFKNVTAGTLGTGVKLIVYYG